MDYNAIKNSLCMAGVYKSGNLFQGLPFSTNQNSFIACFTTMQKINLVWASANVARIANIIYVSFSPSG